MKNIHKQLDENINNLGNEISEMEPGTEAHQRAVDNYVSMYRASEDTRKAEKEFEFEEQKTKKEFEFEEWKTNTEKKTRIWTLAALFVGGLVMTIAENFGLLMNSAKRLWGRIKH